MYQNAKRDVHIFSEPRSRLKVNRRGPPRTAPLNYPRTPEKAPNSIGVCPQQPGVVTPSPAPVVLDSHLRYPLASADVTTKLPKEAHTHYELSSAPLVQKHNTRFSVTNAYETPVWKHFQNSRMELEEFEWHLRCATLLFFNWLVTIYRIWKSAAWYISACAFQTFLVRILIPQLSTVWSAVIPIFRHSAIPVWALSIVDVILRLALEATEVVSIELARRANKSNGPTLDGWKNAHVSIPMEKTVDVPASGATITVLYDPLPTAKNIQLS